jgi:phospholipase/carboxylesterase
LTQHRHAFEPALFVEAGRLKGAADLGGVLVHGRYRTPEEMIYLSSRLDLDNIRWIAPAAGHDRSWYPGLFMDPVPSNEPALTHAIELIDSAVDRASENGRLGPRRLVMIGFSQGACLTVEYALRHPGKCATLIAFTGGLFGPPGTQWNGQPDMLAGTRVLLTGSDADDWIPEERVHETARVLDAMGAEVRLRIYHGRPHEVSDAELTEASALIGKSLPANVDE